MMSKLLPRLLALLIIGSLVACGSDDPKSDTGKSRININGTAYTITEGSTMGNWNGSSFAQIEFYTKSNENNSLNKLLWEAAERPRTGDIISDKNLIVTVGSLSLQGSPTSGKATVTAANTTNQTITIAFDQLVVTDPVSNTSCTITGTLESEFRF